ncbi:MAG: FAD:protein FMN transferase [Clostridia bacterium]|nr:FAD:protein FMN transferase [Clostridia bacterium]
MIRKKLFLPVLTAILSALLFSGCAAKSASAQFFAMDTVMEMTVYGTEAEQALSLAEQEIYRLDAAISAKNENSEIAGLNRSGRAELSADAAELVSDALRAAELTGGAYDPTVGSLMALWGFGTEHAAVPKADDLAKTLSGVDWEQVTLQGETVIMPDGFSFDPGGIGKGFAAERAKRALRDAGVQSALLSLGGNISALGAKPDGSDWLIGIQDPRDAASQFAFVRIRDAAVVTSGGYQRYFEEDGVRYCHILDPKTGWPADKGLLSVTIVCKDDAMADALSTALYVMGAEKAEDFWRQSAAAFDCVLVDENGRVFITQGLQDKITCPGGFEVWTK